MVDTFIQWKGTAVCMDVYCKCGYHGHVDGDFCYEVECPKCKQQYRVGSEVKLEPITNADNPFPMDHEDDKGRSAHYDYHLNKLLSEAISNERSRCIRIVFDYCKSVHDSESIISKIESGK